LAAESGYSAVGAVVGATHPRQAAEIRAVLPKAFFLVPGYGAQGGKAEDLKACFNPDGLGAVVNSSRGIIAAWEKDPYKGLPWEKAVAKAVVDMKADINVALAASVLGAAAVGLWAMSTEAGARSLARFIPADRSSKAPTPQTLAIYMAASLVVLILGLVDDRKRLTARFKLFIQTIVAVGVATFGQHLRLFDAPAPVGIAVTVLWILAVTNAFNLLDHMDGLSSGVALLSGAAFLVVALQTGQSHIAAAIVPLLG